MTSNGKIPICFLFLQAFFGLEKKPSRTGRAPQPSTHPTEFYKFGSKKNRWLGWQPTTKWHEAFFFRQNLKEVTGTLGGDVRSNLYNPPVVLNFGVKEMSCHKAARWWEKSHGFPSLKLTKSPPWIRGRKPQKARARRITNLQFSGVYVSFGVLGKVNWNPIDDPWIFWRFLKGSSCAWKKNQLGCLGKEKYSRTISQKNFKINCLSSPWSKKTNLSTSI